MWMCQCQPQLAQAEVGRCEVNELTFAWSVSLHTWDGEVTQAVSLIRIGYFWTMLTFSFFVSFFRFQVIYSGTSVSHKISKLMENRQYRFRLCASNAAGQGPYSHVYEFQTTYTLPPPVKGKTWCLCSKFWGLFHSILPFRQLLHASVASQQMGA